MHAWVAGNAGGSEHQSPLIPVRSPRHQGQTPQIRGHGLIWNDWQYFGPPYHVAADGHQQNIGSAFIAVDAGRQEHTHRLFHQQRGLCSNSLYLQAAGGQLVTPVLQWGFSHTPPPSPQKAIVEDMTLLSESDAEGGCAPSCRTGDHSDSSAPSRPRHQATC